MRISDWSSDVCSSDLGYQAFSPGKPVPSWAGNYALMASGVGELGQDELDRLTTGRRIGMQFNIDDDAFEMNAVTRAADLEDQLHLQIGRASCRERVCQYV